MVNFFEYNENHKIHLIGQFRFYSEAELPNFYFDKVLYRDAPLCGLTSESLPW